MLRCCGALLRSPCCGAVSFEEAGVEDARLAAAVLGLVCVRVCLACLLWNDAVPNLPALPALPALPSSTRPLHDMMCASEQVSPSRAQVVVSRGGSSTFFWQFLPMPIEHSCQLLLVKNMVLYTCVNN